MVEDKEQYKKSIRFFNDREVRAVWDEEHSKWWFSVLDIIAAINEQDDYQKTRNYWKYLKTKLRKENSQLVSATNQLKLKASDGKSYKTDTFDAEGVTMDKYVEMKIRANEHHVNLFTNGRVHPNLCNVAHPFMEGNGRSTRIWLDLMLKRSLKRCVDWSQIDKNEYLTAMRESVADSTLIKTLVLPALTTKIDDREMLMKGIDYSYYYEQND